MMNRKPTLFTRLATGRVYFFLYAPILVLVVFSFNSTKSRSVWSGFTLDWYAELFQDEAIMIALRTTLLVSALSALIAAVIGTFAAIGFYNMKKKPRGFFLSISNIPVINADIVTGVSISLLMVLGLGAINSIFGTHFQLGFGTLLIAHISFNIPYVILSVMPKLYQMDKNLFEAAQDLGCTWMQAFWKVIVPEIRPGIVNGIITAFTMSIDDFVISYFAAGSGAQTLSMVIYSMTRMRISPEINALSTLLFVTVLALMSIINLREAHQEKRILRAQRQLSR